MRVLWLTENHPPSRGGMAQSCDRVVRGLRTSGVEVDVAHLTRRRVPATVRRESGGHLLTCPLADDPEHALRLLWTTLEAMPEHPAGEACGYTHLVAFGGAYPVLAAPVLAAWLDVPLITLLRGNDFDTGVFSMRRRAALLDSLRASATVCVVAGAHRRLVSALAPGVPVTLVSNGIDVTDWQVLPSERQQADAFRAEQPPGRRVIGLIGHLKRKKGVMFLLDALRTSGHLGSFHLLVAGEVEDPVADWLAAHADEVSVTRLPFLDRFELPSVYARCDLVALPSFYDGLPNVALEAAALGVPLLASNAGGLADLVDEEIGFTFTAGDAHGCRAAIDRAARAGDEELAKRGAAAAERVRRDFSVAAETAGYRAVLAGTQSSR